MDQSPTLPLRYEVLVGALRSRAATAREQDRLDALIEALELALPQAWVHRAHRAALRPAG